MVKKIEINEKALLFRINKLYHDKMNEKEMYEATRGFWKIGSRRESADFAFMVFKGEVKEIYRIDSWHPAGNTMYETRPYKDINFSGRWEFQGRKAEDSIREKYLGGNVSHYFQKGNANPVFYINC